MSAKKAGKHHTPSKKQARFPRIEAGLRGAPVSEPTNDESVAAEATPAEATSEAMAGEPGRAEARVVEDPVAGAATGDDVPGETTPTEATLPEPATADTVAEPPAGAAKSTEALAEAMGEAPVAQSSTEPPTVEVVGAEVEGAGAEGMTQDAATPTPTGTIPESSPVARETEKPKKLRKARAAQAAADDGKVKKLSALDAAAKVLEEAGQPMGCKEMIGAMAAKGYWSSPGGKTPEATLYSAVLRELNSRGEQARFVKAQRGKFGLRPTA
jgi:HB1, ASXL, restriction endonuclease HTH domain